MLHQTQFLFRVLLYHISFEELRAESIHVTMYNVNDPFGKAFQMVQCFDYDLLRVLMHLLVMKMKSCI